MYKELKSFNNKYYKDNKYYEIDQKIRQQNLNA